MPTVNSPAPGISYYTPEQIPAAGTAIVPQPDGKPIPKLFQPLTIRGLTFQNRIFVSPMCQYSAEDGKMTPWHMAHLGGIVSRGPGLTIIEASAVVPEGRITPQDVGIWSDAQLPSHAQIVEFAHSQNQKIAIQLAHAGRKASCVAPWIEAPAAAGAEVGGWLDNVWAPSAIPYAADYPKPKELTTEGIKAIVAAFAGAAKRSVRAGYDVIEIHNAHGYLLFEFLSPVSNKRTDDYGGSFENRARLTLEVIDAIRAVIPKDMPLFLRISATDWMEELGGESWTTEDTVKIAPILAEHGVDFIDVSTGGNNPLGKSHPLRNLKAGGAYQAPFAEAVKKAAGSKIFVGAVGTIVNGHLAQGVLDKDQADVALVGRQFQKHPGTVWAFADDLGVELHHAHQIGWGFQGRF